jgi:predicted ferric reductase
MPFRDLLSKAVWAAIYLLFILAPLFALLAGRLPPSRDFGTEFSVALGYSGLAMMGLQFGLTARFRYITEPWGEDVIYHFHRRISLLAVGLVVTHPLILFAIGSNKLAMPDSIAEVPWGARFAMLSIGSLIALVVMALWRTKLRIRYEIWHLTHIVLAVVAVAAGMLHMVGWGFYLVDPWKRSLWIGMTVFWIGLLLYVRIFKPLFMLRRPYRVAGLRTERGDTATLVMRPDGHPGFRFTPGQFGWLTLWGSPFRITGHPFSFSSSAEAADGRVEMTIRNLGDFTSAIPKVSVGQRHHADDEHDPDPRRPRRQTPVDPALRRQGLGVAHVPGRAGGAEGATRSDDRLRAIQSAGRLDRRTRAHHRRCVPATSAAAVRRSRILHLRAERHDGCHRGGTGRDAGADL